MDKTEGKAWYAFRQADDGSVEVYLYDEIGAWGVTASQFQQEWKAAVKGAKRVDVRLNSPGGAVSDGTAIYNLIRRAKPAVTVWIDGLAASVAATIAMAGDTVKIAKNAMMMIHNPWALVAGDAKELRRMADVLDKYRDASITAYIDKTGKSVEDVAAIMDAETWFSGAEAVEAGFADEVVDLPIAKASWDAGKYEYLQQSERFRAAFCNPAEGLPEPRLMEGKIMPDETPKQEQPDLEKIRREAEEKGAAKECERVKAIRAAAFDGQDELVDKLIADRTPVLEAVLQLNQAQKAKGLEALQKMAEQSAQIEVSNAAPKERAQKGISLDEAKDSFKRVYLMEGKSEIEAERMARKAVGLV